MIWLQGCAPTDRRTLAGRAALGGPRAPLLRLGRRSSAGHGALSGREPPARSP